MQAQVLWHGQIPPPCARRAAQLAMCLFFAIANYFWTQRTGMNHYYLALDVHVEGVYGSWVAQVGSRFAMHVERGRNGVAEGTAWLLLRAGASPHPQRLADLHQLHHLLDSALLPRPHLALRVARDSEVLAGVAPCVSVCVCMC